MSHFLKAFKVIVSVFRNENPTEKIISESVISYDDEKGLEDLDLVYKSYVDNLRQPRSRLVISGDTIIDWENDFATDRNGNPTTLTWYQTYGLTPLFQVWFDPGTGDYELINIPVRFLSSTSNYQIDATGLTDVVVIIS